MAVSVLETIKSRANAGNTAYIAVLSLLCDTYSELPTQYGLTGYELAQGCKAHVIDTNTDYMLDSTGTWHIYGGEIWQNVYTKTETDALLDDKQDELTTAQLDAVNSGVTAARLSADEAALAELVNSGPKNLLKITASSSSGNVNFTVNGDGTITVDGTADTSNVIFVVASGLTIPSGNYYISMFDNSAYYSDKMYISAQFKNTPSGSSTWIGHEYYTDTQINPAGDIQSVAIVVKAGQTISQTVQPMICTKAAWDVSKKFVPYCPTLYELYQMILALQSN